jgi:hypothetical protein
LASLPTVDTGTRSWVEHEIAEQRTDAQDVGFPQLHGTAMVERQFQLVDGNWTRTPSTDFLRGLLVQVWHQDMFSSYREAACPVAVVLATTDDGPLDGQPSFRNDHLEALARTFPTLGDLLPARRGFTVAASHMMPIEDPDALADLLGRILPAGPSRAVAPTG